jgi:hypothetical protein
MTSLLRFWARVVALLTRRSRSLRQMRELERTIEYHRRLSEQAWLARQGEPWLTRRRDNRRF